MADFGISFFPSENRLSPGGGQGATPPVNPLQEAIRVLSLHLPRMTGPPGLAPQSLLSGPGGQGSNLLAILQRLLGGGMGLPQGGVASPAGVMGGPSMGQAPLPMPHVTPGGTPSPEGPWSPVVPAPPAPYFGGASPPRYWPGPGGGPQLPRARF